MDNTLIHTTLRVVFFYIKRKHKDQFLQFPHIKKVSKDQSFDVSKVELKTSTLFDVAWWLYSPSDTGTGCLDFNFTCGLRPNPHIHVLRFFFFNAVSSLKKEEKKRTHSN